MLDIFDTVELDSQAEAFSSQVREILQEAYEKIMDILPEPTRETSLFVTAFQEAGMWAQRSIAVNDVP